MSITSKWHVCMQGNQEYCFDVKAKTSNAVCHAFRSVELLITNYLKSAAFDVPACTGLSTVNYVKKVSKLLIN